MLARLPKLPLLSSRVISRVGEAVRVLWNYYVQCFFSLTSEEMAAHEAEGHGED